MLPWFYMWSQKYELFHRLLVDTVTSTSEPNITLKPLFIDQAVFDAELDQTKAHPWIGCARKVVLLLEHLKGSKEPYILFTDIDIVVKGSVYEKLAPHMESETSMVFLKEGEHCNIGVCLLRCCPEVISFWEIVLAHMQASEKVHDQAIVNSLLPGYPGSWCTFSTKDFACSNTWDGSPFVMFQPLSSRMGPELDFAEKIFYSAQFVNLQDYMKYVPEEIIPFIYKFQDYLLERNKVAASEN